MEGYIAAIVVGSAALTVPRVRRARFAALLSFAVVTLALLAAVGVIWAFGLRDWLTVAWALGLLASCTAVATHLVRCPTVARTVNVSALIVATLGLSLSSAGLLFPSSDFVVTLGVAHAPYRNDIPFILLGDALLSLTAMGIAFKGLR